MTQVTISLGYEDTDQQVAFTASKQTNLIFNISFLVFTISKGKLLAEFERIQEEIKGRLLTQLLIIGAVILVILIIALQFIF